MVFCLQTLKKIVGQCVHFPGVLIDLEASIVSISNCTGRVQLDDLQHGFARLHKWSSGDHVGFY